MKKKVSQDKGIYGQLHNAYTASSDRVIPNHLYYQLFI